MLYPRESAWFPKLWLDYLERNLFKTGLLFFIAGCLCLYIVWSTNGTLLLLVLGSFLFYSGLKYLVLGPKFIELSRRSLDLPDRRRQLSGLWLVLGGLLLSWLSTAF